MYLRFFFPSCVRTWRKPECAQITEQRCQDTHRDIQKSTAQHTTGSISHPRQEQPQEFQDPTTPAIACFHVILTLFSSHSRPLKSVYFICSASSSPLWTHNRSLLVLSFFPPTRISVTLPESSVIIFFPSSSPPPLLSCRFPSLFLNFSLQCYLSTLCTHHQHFSFPCHHPSPAAGEVCGDMQIGCLWRPCLHRQTATG